MNNDISVFYQTKRGNQGIIDSKKQVLTKLLKGIKYMQIESIFFLVEIP